MLEKTAVGVAVSVGVGALAGWWAWRRYTSLQLPDEWEEVGEVSDLTIFPLKSGRGVSVEQAQATTHGLAHGDLQDRSFLVVQAKDCRFVTCRQAGRLTMVALTLEDHTVTLEADGFPPIKFDLQKALREWKIVHTKVWTYYARGVDCGDEAAKWLTTVLFNGETEVRLLYKGNLVEDRPARRMDYYDFPRYRNKDRTYYADTCAYLLTSESSLKDLNDRLEDPVTMARFRANIIVRGAPPFDEDDWAFVKIGQVVLRLIKPCQRCITTTVDPTTGERNPEQEPLASLRRFRILSEPPSLAKAWEAKPIFGINMGIDVTGPVKVGDKVLVARASVNPQMTIF
ncbi:mitochondrial amidoxime reducing component 2-like [Panulirus ornatus]|uniref:mitochondrial amidoxime reducing component 2-like n=1 Tax=Panulirus ornatus TaxID=150431 RepID=UPI003A83FA9D